jgi:Flp pilus assembly protein TadB
MRPTIGQIVWETLDLAAGLGIVLLPLLLTALPGIILLLVLPVLLLGLVAAAPVVIAGAILAPPYLLLRSLRRMWNRRQAPPGRRKPAAHVV